MASSTLTDRISTPVQFSVMDSVPRDAASLARTHHLLKSGLCYSHTDIMGPAPLYINTLGTRSLPACLIMIALDPTSQPVFNSDSENGFDSTWIYHSTLPTVIWAASCFLRAGLALVFTVLSCQLPLEASACKSSPTWPKKT